jgi:uncharacterized protein (DUF2267 family)
MHEVVRMSADQFTELLADDLQISAEQARTRARAVLETIREAVTPGEFHDILVQLPSGFYEHIVAWGRFARPALANA